MPDNHAEAVRAYAAKCAENFLATLSKAKREGKSDALILASKEQVLAAFREQLRGQLLFAR